MKVLLVNGSSREKGCTLTGAEDLEIRHLNVLKGV